MWKENLLVLDFKFLPSNPQFIGIFLEDQELIKITATETVKEIAFLQIP